jgi:hypothetical protein
MNVVEAKEAFLILSVRTFSGITEGEIDNFPQSRFPFLAEMDIAEEVVARLRLGPIFGYRLFSSAGLTDHHRDLVEWGKQWAIELADEHIARTHPDFETAKHIMTDLI